MFIWSQSTDETVLHASHANIGTTTSTATTSMDDNNLLLFCEAEDNNKVFPENQLQKYMPADNNIICPPNNTLEDDELEALVRCFILYISVTFIHLYITFTGCSFLVRCTKITLNQWIN